ncbi:hypothetical protein FRC11_002353 [Ceratobasidium sp. 423]|nr:hypothetical protein FRC11_002353 [Ceratobasidium sp. 423]
MGDPNFPSNLAIQPSQPASDQNSRANLQFDQKSGIETYGIAGRVWEAAYVLGTYTTSPTEGTKLDSTDDSNGRDFEFDPPCSLFRADTNVTVIEVGSGTGYAGVYLAQQLSLFRRGHGVQMDLSAADMVILTDLPNVVPLLDKGLREHAESFGQVEVQAQALAWGDTDHAAALAQSLGETGRSVTHVLCSDLDSINAYFTAILPRFEPRSYHRIQSSESGQGITILASLWDMVYI